MLFIGSSKDKWRNILLNFFGKKNWLSNIIKTWVHIVQSIGMKWATMATTAILCRAVDSQRYRVSVIESVAEQQALNEKRTHSTSSQSGLLVTHMYFHTNNSSCTETRIFFLTSEPVTACAIFKMLGYG